MDRFPPRRLISKARVICAAGHHVNCIAVGASELSSLPFACPRCHQAWYCSLDCRQEHWEEWHHLICHRLGSRQYPELPYLDKRSHTSIGRLICALDPERNLVTQIHTEYQWTHYQGAFAVFLQYKGSDLYVQLNRLEWKRLYSLIGKRLGHFHCHPEMLVSRLRQFVGLELPEIIPLEDPHDKTCIVCMDAVKSVRLLPCTHRQLCHECASDPRLRLCPTCRTPITQILPC